MKSLEQAFENLIKNTERIQMFYAYAYDPDSKHFIGMRMVDPSEIKIDEDTQNFLTGSIISADPYNATNGESINFVQEMDLLEKKEIECNARLQFHICGQIVTLTLGNFAVVEKTNSSVDINNHRGYVTMERIHK